MRCKFCGEHNSQHVHPFTIIDGIELSMAQVILRVPAGTLIRHVNGDTSDYRRSNLELV